MKWFVITRPKLFI